MERGEGEISCLDGEKKMECGLPGKKVADRNTFHFASSVGEEGRGKKGISWSRPTRRGEGREPALAVGE